MPRGRCIAIGLNKVDTGGTSYQGVDVPTLQGCINDANSIASLVKSLPNYEVPRILTDDKATYANVMGALASAANDLQQGDFLLVHYSGHGMRGAMVNGALDPNSSANSSWILYDKPLASDDLYHAWFQFQPHVCILVLSDSCHSGRAIRDRDLTFGPRFIDRGLDELARIHILNNNRQYYQERESSLNSLMTTAAAPNANVVLISGCQEAETSLDGADANGTPHGVFTAAILDVMNSGFADDYNAFYTTVRHEVSAQTQQQQNPNYLWVGGNFFELGMFGRLKPPFRV